MYPRTRFAALSSAISGISSTTCTRLCMVDIGRLTRRRGGCDCLIRGQEHKRTKARMLLTSIKSLLRPRRRKFDEPHKLWIGLKCIMYVTWKQKSKQRLWFLDILRKCILSMTARFERCDNGYSTVTVAFTLMNLAWSLVRESTLRRRYYWSISFWEAGVG